MSAFDVILKSYNRPWLLGVCLESLCHHWGRQARIIVADDGTEPHLWAEAMRRYGHLADEWVHSVAGEAKWPLCREGRFADVLPTCGRTWNEAAALVRAPVTFLIEDDSYLTRAFSPVAASAALVLSGGPGIPSGATPDLLCIIGLKERCAMESADGPCLVAGTSSAPERLRLAHHAFWPWSFDGIFYRTADWAKIGPWPEGVATGPMEGFVQNRLRDLGWMDRPFAVAEPFCQFDAACSVRTDHPSTYAGRFRHVDACNAAWLAGDFAPTYAHVLHGRAPWIDPLRTFGMGLHYPRGLRQVSYVTGHELCGDLAGVHADARWLSQANSEAERYGEEPWSAVPEGCRSA